jgi:glycerol-3-phosphate O-acyltransferase
MRLYQAYVVLKHHAEWRQGEHAEMVKPERLTQALNLILNDLQTKLTKESHAAI